MTDSASNNPSKVARECKRIIRKPLPWCFGHCDSLWCELWCESWLSAEVQCSEVQIASGFYSSRLEDGQGRTWRHLWGSCHVSVYIWTLFEFQEFRFKNIKLISSLTWFNIVLPCSTMVDMSLSLSTSEHLRHHCDCVYCVRHHLHLPAMWEWKLSNFGSRDFVQPMSSYLVKR